MLCGGLISFLGKQNLIAPDLANEHGTLPVLSERLNIIVREFPLMGLDLRELRRPLLTMDSITLYDLQMATPGQPWSPNSWRVR